MKRRAILGGLMIMLWIVPAHAGGLPDDILDKDYQACMGGTNEPQRAAYCTCIRTSMQNWDLDAYAEMSTNISRAGDSAQLPAQLTQLAQECIAKTLR